MPDETLNVLHVNVTIDPVAGGGTAVRTMEVARSLSKLGHCSSILALDIGVTPSLQDELAEAGVRLHLIPCLVRRFFIPSLSLKQMFGAVRNADVVHIMGHWTLLNVIAYFAVRYYGRPYVVSPAGALPLFGRSIPLKRAFNFLIGNSIIRRANGWIAITEDERGQFSPYGVHAAETVVIPNGVDVDRFRSARIDDIRRQYGISPGMKIILFMGRLNSIKGPDILLESFIALPELHDKWTLVFAGPDGGLLQELTRQCAANGVQNNVMFCGHVGGDEKSDLYHAAEFLVIPSRQEAMSIVVLESGACSRPVLLTAACGFNEVEEMGGGLVVEATPDAVRAGLKALTADNNLHVKGDALNRLVTSMFTWEAMGLKFIEMYAGILGRPFHASMESERD